MEEKERIASEETEKRLKAALSAKREPGTIASRVASPAAVGANVSEPSPEPKVSVAIDDKPMTEDTVAPLEDVVMDVSDAAALVPVVDVSTFTG